MEYNIQQKIAARFGLMAFRTGGHTRSNAQGETIEEYVKFLWAAEVGGYTSPLIVAVKHTNFGIQGLLLVLSGDDHEQRRAVKPIVTGTVEMPGWNDPVVNQLRSIDLLTRGGHSYDEDDYSIQLFFEAGVHFAEISFVYPVSQPSLDKLGEGVVSSIWAIAAQYDSHLLNKFLDDRPALREND